MRKAINIPFLLFFPFFAMAQKSLSGELHFNHLFAKDGMPEGTVTSIAQDKEGYMWIGTEKGLVRYDGYSPKVYNLGIENPYQQDIRIIYLDREDRIWAGGKYGVLLLYDRAEDRFIQYKLNSPAPDSSSWGIYDILEDHHGNLWLLNYNFINKKELLQRFDLTTNKFIKYDITEKGSRYINVTRFTNFLEDDKGAV